MGPITGTAAGGHVLLKLDDMPDPEFSGPENRYLKKNLGLTA